LAEIPAKIKEEIYKYLAELEKNNFHIQQAYLFGSYSNGKFTKWSDIDIALVSDSFDGIRILDKDKIRKITLSINTDLSPMTYRPEDFTPDNPFVREIIQTGFKFV
jgi:predicted nucleotidyltransferase